MGCIWGSLPPKFKQIRFLIYQKQTTNSVINFNVEKKEKQTQNINRLFIQQILIEHLLCIRKHKVLERKQSTRHCPCLLGLKIYLKYEMSITK